VKVEGSLNNIRYFKKERTRRKKKNRKKINFIILVSKHSYRKRKVLDVLIIYNIVSV